MEDVLCVPSGLLVASFHPFGPPTDVCRDGRGKGRRKQCAEKGNVLLLLPR